MKSKSTFWMDIPFKERHKYKATQNYYRILSHEEFFNLRREFLNSNISFQQWQRMMRQIFGFRLPSSVQELMSSIYFAKTCKKSF